MTKEEIGQILKGLRVKANMTQKEVAEAIGRKQQVIGHWETGYSQPDANTLFVLCDLYGADINVAFGFTTKRVSLSRHEQLVIQAYRDNPAMQAAVNRLLGISGDDVEIAMEFVADVQEYRAEWNNNLTEEEAVQLVHQRYADAKRGLPSSSTYERDGKAEGA